MRRVWLKRASVVLPLLCLFLFGTAISARLLGNAASASAASLVPLPGHVPALIKSSTLVGPTDLNQNISLSIGLQLRNAAALKVYADNTVRSRATRKPQHLTSAQIAAAFAPLASSQQAVIKYMQGYGFKVTTTIKQHLIVGFNGTVGDAENAFHLIINNYRAPGGQSFYAPANDPVVPANLARLIQSVIGLDNVAQPARTVSAGNRVIKATNTSVANTNVACPNQGSGSPYLPSTIASAYNLNSFYNAGFRGEGQSVALIEDDTYYPSDITAYTHCFGGGSVPIHEIRTDGYPLGSPGADAFTVEKDIELVLSAAPHLANLYIYELPYDNSDTNIINMLAQIISNNDISVISYSYSLVQCEPQMALQLLQQENTLFTLAAVQGQTIFASAGNTGNDACEIYDPSNPYQPSVRDPASQPYVTGVGGTTLTLANNATTYGSETTWNYGVEIKDAAGNVPFGASGGGISTIWPMPSWQQGPGVINTNSSGTPCGATSGYCREVPDVSLNADPRSGYLVYCAGGYCPNATSLNGVPYGNSGVWWIGAEADSSTTLWAVFMALTNEKTLHDGGFNIGFINPYLYQIAQSSTMYANDFHDITTGNNDVLGDNFYTATTGYDMATGLGSYNAWNLANDLEKLANAQNGTRQAPANTTWYFAEGSVGGSFQEFLTILNPSTQNATLDVQYLFSNSPAKTVQHVIAANSRGTINVNSDLGIPANGPHQSISTIVTSVAANTLPAVPVVAERPLYFNSGGIDSGTDTLGATSITHTTFYFAAGNSTQSSTQQFTEFLTILNPSNQTAEITANFYSGGQVVDTESVNVPPLQRGTITPRTYHGQAAIQVTSTNGVGVVVERPSYVVNSVIPNLSGRVSGATSTVGATDPGTDWLFAEGSTRADYQEDLVLANFASSPTTATIHLEYTNGSVQTVQCSVNGQSQYTFHVNDTSANPGCTITAPGTPTSDVSVEVTSVAPIVAERVMYVYIPGSAGPSYMGMTDVVGEAGPSSHTTYSFAEGYTNGSYVTFLTLLNPTGNAEVVAVTVFADNTIVEQEVTLPAHSRTTISLNSIVNPIANAYPAPGSRNVSTVVQALSGTIVAERPEYFNASGTDGETDILGYSG